MDKFDKGTISFKWLGILETAPSPERGFPVPGVGHPNSGNFLTGWQLAMALSPSDSKQLNEELRNLQNINIMILKQSAFGGMTETERSEYEARQKRIVEIVTVLQREAG